MLRLGRYSGLNNYFYSVIIEMIEFSEFLVFPQNFVSIGLYI